MVVGFIAVYLKQDLKNLKYITLLTVLQYTAL